MTDQQLWSIQRAAGFFLVVGAAANVAGVLMFWLRGGERGGAPPSPTFFVWERGLVMVAVVLTAIGFVLLDSLLHPTPGRVLARTAATAYLFGAVLGVAAEALGLEGGLETLYPLIVIYVVMAFLAQAAIGGAVLQSGLLAAWIGWFAILWNLGWLVALPVITPRDIYFPVLHHFTPLLIGGALLWKKV